MGADAVRIKQQFDMRDIVEKSLGPPVRTKRSESTWPCPFHDEKSVGGFHVWEDGYRCFSCGAQGDIFTWHEEFLYLDFKSTLAKLNGGEMPVSDFNPEQAARIMAEKAERAEQRLKEEIERAQEVVKTLEEGKKWIEYHSNLDQISEALWAERGIKDRYWLDYWNLGYNPAFKIWDKTGDKWNVKHTSPTLTIPIFKPAWGIANIKHRLLDPQNNPRYMQEKSGVKAATWIAQPDLAKYQNTAIVVEGEIKAMNVFVTYDDPNMQVFGIPSSTPDDYALQPILEYDQYILILDPDTYAKRDGMASWSDVPIMKLADQLGRSRCRHIRLKEKIDDMIIEYNLDKYWLHQQVNMAKKFKV